MCFPSPTSVADVVATERDDHRKKALREELQGSVDPTPPDEPDPPRNGAEMGEEKTYHSSVDHHQTEPSHRPAPQGNDVVDESENGDNLLSDKQKIPHTPDDHNSQFQEKIHPDGNGSSDVTTDDVVNDVENSADHLWDGGRHEDHVDDVVGDVVSAVVGDGVDNDHDDGFDDDGDTFYDASDMAANGGSFHRPELLNSNPSDPLERVTKEQFVAALDNFVNAKPPNAKAPPHLLVKRLRELLDHLDALVEQISLRVTNTLFDALSHTNCLSMLLFLLSDISASSTPVIQDVRKSYRYPYLVANILANGSMGVRDAFMGSKPLVGQLLSFLDGEVHLTTGSVSDNVPAPLARDNPVIVGNVVQIVVSYMETSPEALLTVLEDRPTFIPAVVSLLRVGSVPKVLYALIPDRCVDDVNSMDHCNVSFDVPLSKALNVLASSAVFHHLAEAFAKATQTIYSIATNNDPAIDPQEEYRAEELSYNVTQVFSSLVNRTLRAVRIDKKMAACYYLNVFANQSTASAISHILRAGTELFRGTEGERISILNTALSLTIDLLRYVEQDRERRVASVTGQPPALETSGFEAELQPLLRTLMSVLIDIVGTGQKHSSLRLHILELFAECTRVCSESMMQFIDKLRFGEVALKVMLMHPQNSLMQHVVSRGVETALLSDVATRASAQHWLVRSKLITKIIHSWEWGEGGERWNSPLEAQEAPFLSALVHMACCVQHFFAMQRERCGESYVKLDDHTRKAFDVFCEETLGPILIQETLLCGPKPRRRPIRPVGGIGRSFGLSGNTSGSGTLRRAGSSSSTGSAHLVRSPSAHRFGYTPPVSSLRSRFDEVFVEGEEEEFEAGAGCSSLASVFEVGNDALG